MILKPVDHNPFEESNAGEAFIDEGNGVKLKPVDHNPFDGVGTETNQLKAGFNTAVDTTQATGYGLAALVGDAIGSDTVRDWGMEGYKRNIEESQQNGLRVQDYADVNNLNDAADYVLGGIGQIAPSVITMIASGGIGGLIAKYGAKKGVEKLASTMVKDGVEEKVAKAAADKMLKKAIQKGQIAGTAAGSIGMQTGSIYGDVAEQGAEGAGAIASSIGGGITSGILDTLPVLGVAKKFGFGSELKRSIESSFIKRLGKEGAKTALAEGATESVQTLIEEATKSFILDKGLPDDIAHQMINAGLLGAIGGGAMGSAVGAIAKPVKNNSSKEQLVDSPITNHSDNTDTGFDDNTDIDTRIDEAVKTVAAEQQAAIQPTQDGDLNSFVNQLVSEQDPLLQDAPIQQPQQAEQPAQDAIDELDSVTPKVPEKPETLALQMQDMLNPNTPREALLITEGEAPIDVPTGYSAVDIPGKGTLIYGDPSTLVKFMQGEDVLGYGTSEKPADTAHLTTTVRDESGAVKQDVIGANEQINNAAQATAGDTGTIEVRPTEEAIAEHQDGVGHMLPNNMPLPQQEVISETPQEPDISPPLISETTNQSDLAASNTEAVSVSTSKELKYEVQKTGSVIVSGDNAREALKQAGITFLPRKSGTALIGKKNAAKAIKFIKSQSPEALNRKALRSQKAAEAARKRKEISSADSLELFVRKVGGVSDGDFIRSFSAKEIGKTGNNFYGSLVHKNGKDADYIAELAHEAGYIQERTPQALYDALDMEVRQGVKQYTKGQEIDIAEQHQRDLEEQDKLDEALLNEYGETIDSIVERDFVLSELEAATDGYVYIDGDVFPAKPLTIESALENYNEAQSYDSKTETQTDRSGRPESQANRRQDGQNTDSAERGDILPKSGQQKLLDTGKPQVSSEPIKLADNQNKPLDLHDENSLFGAKERAEAKAKQPDILFSRSAKNTFKSLEDVKRSWDNKGIKHFITEDKDIITVHKIIVDEKERGKGIGSQAMDELEGYANRKGKQIALTPSADFGGNKTRLTKFYKKRGFKKNTEYISSESLIREPAKFSRSKTKTTSPVTLKEADVIIGRVIDRVKVSLGISKSDDKIIIVDSFSDLPPSITKQADNENHNGSDVDGVFHNGKVYLVKNNLARHSDIEANTEKALLHEFVHSDMRAMFGKDLTQAMNSLWLSIGGNKGIREIAKARNIDLSAYAKAGLESGGSKAYRQAVMMDELLAHIGQVKPNLKDKVKRIIGMIRQWLRDKGLIKLAKYGETDLLSLISTARKQAVQAKGDDTRFIRNKGHRAEKTIDLPSSLSKAIQQTNMITLQGKRGSAGNAEYKAAKFDGDNEAALNVVMRVIKDKKIDELKSLLDTDKKAYVVPIQQQEKTATNRIPLAYAEVLAGKLGATVHEGIDRSDGNANTGVTQAERLMNQISFEGAITDKNGQYIIVDDVYTSGGTIMALIDHITAQGGDVKVVSTLASNKYGAGIKPEQSRIDTLLQTLKMTNDEASAIIGHSVGGLTNAEINIIIRAIGTKDPRKAFARIFESGIKTGSPRYSQNNERARNEGSSTGRLNHGLTKRAAESLLIKKFGNRVKRSIEAGDTVIVRTESGLPDYAKNSVEQNTESFAKDVDAFVDGTLPRNKPLMLGDTPHVIQLSGATSLPITMSHKVADKVLNLKHELSVGMLKKIPDAINDPIMVFKSATQDNSLVVMTELKHGGKTVVVTLHMDVDNHGLNVNAIGSVHPRENNSNFTSWINRNLLQYANKEKSRKWFQGARLQLPRALNQSDFKAKYKTEKDLAQVRYSDDGNIQGAFDPVTKKTYIVANNNTEASLPSVLLHEAGHAFFTSEKGKAAKNKAIANIIKADSLARNGKGKVAEWVREAKRAIPKDTPPEAYHEEILAYAIQQYSEAQNNMPVTIKGIVKRLLDTMKAYVMKHTKLIFKADPALLTELAKQHIGTRAHGKDGALEAGVQYSRQFSDYIVQALKMLSKGEKDLFQYPDSKAKGFDKIVADIALNGDITVTEDKSVQNVDKSWKVTMNATVKGEDATATAGVYQNGKYVWINAISLKEGISGGSKLYHAVATYAHNNSLVFRGDPAGLKPVAHYRRLENMLSSALRFGTTDHIQPHAKQLKGLNEGGWKLSPLKWVTGDTDANIQAMLDLSAEYVYAAIPAIKDIGFDFETGAFYDENIQTNEGANEGITEETWVRYARSQRARKNGIGSKTLKRIVFWNALRGERHGVLAKLSKFTHLSGLGEAKGIFYSKGRGVNGTNLGGLKDETALGWWKRRLSDKFSRLEQVQKHIQDKGGNVNMNNNAYLAEERSSGIITARIDDMEHEHVDPLLEEMRNTGTSLSDLDEYLMARHAIERNKYIASINPKMQDGGSGISNADALEVLAKVHKADKDKVYKSLAARVYAINKESVQVMFDGGLIDKKTYDLWTSQYKYYVPLKGKDGEEFGGGTGRGFSVSSSGIKKAMGRGDGNIAESPLAHSISQLKESIIRDEKNKVGRILVKLVLDNPEKELWTMTRNDYDKFITENGELSEGLVEEPNNQGWEEGKQYHRVLGVKDGVKQVFYRIDPQYRNNDDVFTTLINGRQVSIFIKDPILAEQMKNLNASKMNSFVATAGVFNRYLAMINTALNPQFVISNFERDLTTAGINIGGEHGKKMFFSMMKSIPSAAAGIANHAFGDKQHPWAKIYEEMRHEGGTIGFFGLEDNDTQVKKMQEKLHKNDKGVKNLTRRNLSLVVEKIMDANSVIENATRLAAYKAAKDAGLTRKQAASLSKNLTVNFNRKGEWGATANALFLFFNASIQGPFRIAKALKHKDVQKIVAAGAAAGFALAAYNMSAGGDDDDGISKWEKIPNHIKQSNIIFMNSDGSYETYRLPYGYNVFWYAGVALHEAIFNKKTTGIQIATNMAVTVVNAFNPIQGSNPLDTIIPTVLKPISQSITNKNYLGLDIVPESKYANYEKPDSEKAWGSTNESLKKLMQNINRLTGGDAYHSGLVDVSPETVKHYVKWFTGGAGMTLWQMGETMTDIANGRKLKPRGVPFWRMVYNDGDTTRYDSERFYASLEMVETGKRSYQDLLKSDKRAALRYRLDNKEVIGHINWAKKAKKKVSTLRKNMKLAKKKGNKTEEQRYKLLMLKEMRRFTAELP